MAFVKKAKSHDAVIATATKLYDDSVKMFVEAETKIDEAQLKLGATIEEIDSAIAGLQDQKNKALADQERNAIYKLKLKEFTTN